MEKFTTTFEPAEITIDANERPIDDIVNFLNTQKQIFERGVFYIDWHYKDFMQAITPDQISVDIVLKLIKKESGEEIDTVTFAVEKHDCKTAHQLIINEFNKLFYK